MANRVLAVVGSMYAWGAKHGLVLGGYNPAAGVEKNPEAGRERFLGTQELEHLGRTLRQAETEGIPWLVDEESPTAKHLPGAEYRRTILSPHAVAALRLLILTGCRLREILHLRWSEVDFDRGMLHLPDSKTGRKSVVLNAPALSVLEAIPHLGEFVIAGRAPSKKGGPERPRSDLKKPWEAIRRVAGLKGLRIHDLRHTFASVGAGAGMGLPIVGKLLGHSQAATTQKYAHLDNDPLRRASNAIGETIAAALDGRKADAPISLRHHKAAKKSRG
jgi:integrase